MPAIPKLYTTRVSFPHTLQPFTSQVAAIVVGLIPLLPLTFRVVNQVAVHKDAVIEEGVVQQTLEEI